MQYFIFLSKQTMKIDLSLYLVTDRNLTNNRSIEWIVEEAVKGGVTTVQLREKECSTRQFYELAIKVKEILKPYKVPLIINDRLDIALACDAEGLHIGQSDIPYKIARRILGYNKIIGLSIENIEQAKDANCIDVDYIGISPVFGTNTKFDIKQPLGLDGIKQIASFSKHPIVGIGGINNTNASEVIKAGANGIAVVTAITMANHPSEASMELKKIIKL